MGVAIPDAWTTSIPPGGSPAEVAVCQRGGMTWAGRGLCCAAALSIVFGASCVPLPNVADSPANGNSAQPPAPSPRAGLPAAVRPGAVNRLAPRGTPAPGAVCGHAVALVGWQPGGGVDDVLLVHDPADNRLWGSGRGEPPHDWRPEALPLAVRYDDQRPGVTLLPAEPYTIMGAVVVAPVAGGGLAPGSAAAMPDLSQEFPGRGPGLCGPTSAANVLYAMAADRPALLAGFRRGPAAAQDVASLVIGGSGLASLMAIGAQDDGATNEGIRAGLEAWLENAEPGRWEVALDWLDDGPRSREDQRRYLEGLASAVARGGGAVLCLWPGREGARDQPAEADPAGAARAVAEAGKSLEAARRSLDRGRPAEAVEAVGRAVAAVRRPAIHDPECRRRLEEALALAAEIDRRTPAPAAVSPTKPTRFE